MKRRRYLGLLAAAGTLAGCTQAPRAGHATPAARPPLPDDTTLPVPESELVPAINAAIPAIVTPAFAPDWEDLVVEYSGEQRSLTLAEEDPVVGVERAGRARAYPLAVLRWHEIVNDDLGGPLLVTYCPLCASAMAAVRTVGGVETTFEVSHILWRSNLLMRDQRTKSLWSQALATAVRGPETGAELDLVPATLTTWGEWRRVHDGETPVEVLLPPPYSEAVWDARRPYDAPPSSEAPSLLGGGEGENTLVVGVTNGDVARAYPFPAVSAAGVINDTVGGLPVVVTVAPGGTLVAYVRRVEGRTLRFEAAGEGQLRAGGSTWQRTTGRAVDGPLAGTQLDSAAALPPMYRFAWEDFNPRTDFYEG